MTLLFASDRCSIVKGMKVFCLWSPAVGLLRVCVSLLSSAVPAPNITQA